ncbi:MAG TPA: hypothetical protein VGO67_23500 [Verrucomicrobiae bacterium]|jgi:hypothetical protein
MILRFEVNQAEAFRRGVDVPKSTIHLEVDPSKLPQDQRDLIANRISGIDVLALSQARKERAVLAQNPSWSHSQIHSTAKAIQQLRIIATAPTYEALLEAVEDDEREYRIQKATAKLTTEVTMEELRKLG